MRSSRPVKPAPGALRQTPIAIVLPLAAGAVVVGWFAPMIGYPLLGFLIVDIAVGLFARRRAAA